MPKINTWTFLTNHTHVIVVLLRDPNSRLRDVAAEVGITERAAQKIVSELVDAKVLTKIKDGRRNRYEINLGAPMRHPVEAGHTLGDLLLAVLASKRSE